MMIGIYIHIPFCASRCAYCDFYSTTNQDALQSDYVEALLRELRMRSNEMKGYTIATIYFGGGTPSQLPIEKLKAILCALRETCVVSPHAEITLEANPDDVTTEWASAVATMGVNRVSLGVQSLNDERLNLIRRRHTANQAVEAVNRIKQAGISNISMDLIYGLPGQSFEEWKHDVSQTFRLPITHLSAYALSYEPSTPLYQWLVKGKVHVVADAVQEAMYTYLRKSALQAGWHQYELSNFARLGYHSRHNSSYWEGLPYIGLGPGAHSYDGNMRRRCNLSQLGAYLRCELAPHQEELLTRENRVDEMLLTRLRTTQGLSFRDIYRLLNCAQDTLHLLRTAHKWQRYGKRRKPTLHIAHGNMHILPRAFFISDALIADLANSLLKEDSFASV